MSGKGGARHFAKPYIDPDIVFKILSDNDLILCNMGPYENVSRQNAPHPKGILHCSRLLMDLLSASETAEVHQSSLKKGLQQFLVQTPDANTSKYSGEVWHPFSKVPQSRFHEMWRSLSSHAISVKVSVKLLYQLCFFDLPTYLEISTKNLLKRHLYWCHPKTDATKGEFSLFQR